MTMLPLILASALVLDGALILEGATVHTMVPGSAAEVTTVLVEDGRITAIGADFERPEDAQVVDLSGMHLVPGLIDGMVHHDMEHDPLYLLSGVTLCRDMGNELGRILLSAMPNMRNRMPGPDLLVAGAIFDGVPPATTEAIIVRNAQEVLDKFPRLVERGIQFASFHQGIPGEAWLQLIQRAHEEGMQVWGPMPNGLDQERVLESGQDGIVYLEGFRQAGETWDPQVAEEAAAAFAMNDVACMPLLHVYGYRTEDQGDDPPIFNYLAPYYADWWRSDLEGRRQLFNEDYVQRGQAQYEELARQVFELWKSGAELVPGSAAPNPWMAPGEGLHDELAAWVAAGIPASEALRLATYGAAKSMRIEKDYGSLQVGLVANAVIVAADPREDLSILREPQGLVLRGAYLDAEYLANLRSALLDAQSQALVAAETPLEIEKPELPDGRVVLTGRVEGKAYERTIAAEDYWVVRCFDGSTSWISRMVLAGGIGQAPARHTLQQNFEDERLQSFKLEIKNGAMVYRVEGLQTNGQFRIKRWLNEQYVDTNSSPRRPHVVDAGMSLPAMIVSHYLERDSCTALYFEGMDPVVVEWELNLADNGVLGFKTAKGPMVATFEGNGALAKLARAEGQATMRYESVRQSSFGGPGMPAKEAKGSSSAAPVEQDSLQPQDG